MSEPAVVFREVWKKYRRGQQHDSLRDLIPWALRSLAGRVGTARLEREEFWAVRDVTFEVRAGEALGIIGHNGAGKSTILKLLTRIIRPTRGSCEVRGRVGALIEIAAGFHPDLTGRENIFLQGALMSMSRAQIVRRFDEIVSFSGLEDFIDTPVKRYSSGMNARLGFSIAAHLEPDVLIIDEVLAVGDFMFQDRAFTRIREIARSRIPVIVVSHQLDRISELCTRAILLERGAVRRAGAPGECIAEYVRSRGEVHSANEGPVYIHRVELRSRARVPSGDSVLLEIAGHVSEPRTELEGVSVRLRALQTGQVLFATSSERLGISLPDSGDYQLSLALQMNVPPGAYWIETSVWDRSRGQDHSAGPAVQVEVDEGSSFWGSVQLNPRMVLQPPRGAVT